jgi:hypothetical protein
MSTEREEEKKKCLHALTLMGREERSEFKLNRVNPLKLTVIFYIQKKME